MSLNGPSGGEQELHHALLALRESPEPLSRSNDEHFRVIDRFLEKLPELRQNDDLQQEVLLVVARAVKDLRAEHAKESARWLRNIVRTRRIDAIRKESKHQRQRMNVREDSEDAYEPEDHGNSALSLSEFSMVDLASSLEKSIHDFFEHQEPAKSPTQQAKRDLALQSARAWLHRHLFSADLPQLRRALGVGDEVAADRIYKWVERGREPWRMWLDQGANDFSEDFVQRFSNLLNAREASPKNASPKNTKKE